MKFKVEAPGLAAVQSALGRLSAAATREAVFSVASEVRTQILVNLGGRVLRVRTSALKRSWSGFPRIQGTPGSPFVVLSSQKIVYARIHEYGGTIRPVSPGVQWLRFKLPSGEWRRAREVTIPARRYVSLAVEYARRRVPALVAAAVARARAALGL